MNFLKTCNSNKKKKEREYTYFSMNYAMHHYKYFLFTLLHLIHSQANMEKREYFFYE